MCLETQWKNSLTAQGWSLGAASHFVASWAESTLSSYNRALENLHDFCHERNEHFPEVKQHVLADYLTEVARSTPRPKSVLNTTVVALSCLSGAVRIKNPVSAEINKLVVGLTKSCTKQPMKRSSAMPTEPFMLLFKSWKGNWFLSTEDLRLKAITLLSLSLMLRPSDIAPQGRVLAEGDTQFEQLELTVHMLRFNPDGSLTITLHGIKNDYSRDGFEVSIPPASDLKIDPVSTLRCYVERTREIHPKSGAVFLTLKRKDGEFAAISSKTVANVLCRAIKLANLDGQGFTAKSFRPTGAICAIEQGLDADVVRRVGRWKSKETFEFHYVHSRTPADFTDKIYVQ